MKGCFPPLLRNNEEHSVITTKFVVQDSEAESFIRTMTPLLFQSWAEVDRVSNLSQETGIIGECLDIFKEIIVIINIYIFIIVLQSTVFSTEA